MLQLRALSLSVMVSDRKRCNAGCRFCISRTTPGDASGTCEVKHCPDDRLAIALGYAQSLGATHGILTGKADPTQENPEYLLGLVARIRERLPLCDMHTNGYLLLPGKRRADLLRELKKAGLTMVTLSIASTDDATNRRLMGVPTPTELIPIARELGLMVRCSLVVNRDGVSDVDRVLDYVRTVGELGAQAVVVREVWRPEVRTPVNEAVYEWNHANAVPIQPIENEISRLAGEPRGLWDTFRWLVHGAPENPNRIHRLYTLPWGRPVFAFGEGTFSDPNHAVQVVVSTSHDNFRGETFQTVVLRPDGHVYGGWESKATILA